MTDSKWIQWLIATAITGIMMGVVIHGCTYTRFEGDLLSKRVDRIEDAVIKRLERIETMIHEIYRDHDVRRKWRIWEHTQIGLTF